MKLLLYSFIEPSFKPHPQVGYGNYHTGIIQTRTVYTVLRLTPPSLEATP